jgi:hypothetical protein
MAIDFKAHTAHKPSVKSPPLRIVRFSGQALLAGIETQLIEGVPVRIYCAAKTVADCFKYRNKIGTDVAIEALRDSLHTKKATVDVRVLVSASFDGARVTMQVDVGFGDAVEPAPVELSFPTLLPLDAPVLRAYPPEAVIAEKFHAMVTLRIANSRMKDFFDIWTFATTQRFDLICLSQSIQKTFERRRTDLPEIPPVALTNEFLQDTAKKTQWAAFCRRLGLRDTPVLDAIGPVLVSLLMPAVEQARQRGQGALTWEPQGPWRQPESSTL